MAPKSALLCRKVGAASVGGARDQAWLKIGARIVRHGRYVVFQLAEVAVPRALFAAILRRIDRLRGPPVAVA
jgi:hypothetical protein